jgi:hypothetical protein
MNVWHLFMYINEIKKTYQVCKKKLKTEKKSNFWNFRIMFYIVSSQFVESCSSTVIFQCLNLFLLPFLFLLMYSLLESNKTVQTRTPKSKNWLEMLFYSWRKSQKLILGRHSRIFLTNCWKKYWPLENHH